MCDIVSIKCQSCKRELPVHIGDFCTGEFNVAARCGVHAPEANDGIEWVKFIEIIDESDFGFAPEEYGTWYLGVWNKELVDPGYGFSGRGICPNTTGWKLEEVAP